MQVALGSEQLRVARKLTNLQSPHFVDVLVTKLVEKALAENSLVTLPSARPKLGSEERLESVIDEAAERWRVGPELESSRRVRDLHQPACFGVCACPTLNATRVQRAWVLDSHRQRRR